MEQYDKTERDCKLSSALIMSDINIKLIVETALGSCILDQRPVFMTLERPWSEIN